jgi:hypothetical protein
VPLLWLRPSTSLLRGVPYHAHGRFDIHIASRRPASALLWRRFTVVGYYFRHPPPAADLPVPSSQEVTLEVQVSLPEQDDITEYLAMNRIVALSEHDYCARSWLWQRTSNILKSPPYMDFPIATKPVDRNCWLIMTSPLPCQTWYGNRIINAHREEVEVRSDGRMSAPPPGPLSAGASRPEFYFGAWPHLYLS